VGRRNAKGRFLKLEAQWNTDSYGSESLNHRGLGTVGRDKQRENDATRNDTIKEITSSKYRNRDVEAINERDYRAHRVKPIWDNSIILKFAGNTVKQQIRQANKYRNHTRFVKLNNGHKIKKIESHQEYCDTLVRALLVDCDCRAANYAYVKLLDIELEKYEQKHPNDCKMIWAKVCCEFFEMSEKRKKV